MVSVSISFAFAGTISFSLAISSSHSLLLLLIVLNTPIGLKLEKLFLLISAQNICYRIPVIFNLLFHLFFDLLFLSLFRCRTSFFLKIIYSCLILRFQCGYPFFLILAKAGN